MNNVKEQKVVLIVEDNDKNLKLFRDLLIFHGFSTIEALDGKVGVEMAQKELPDLIIMDVQMPIMDGVEAVKILRNDTATKEIPILALTAYAMVNDLLRLRDVGFDGIITKPIDVASFMKQIQKYI